MIFRERNDERDIKHDLVVQVLWMLKFTDIAGNPDVDPSFAQLFRLVFRQDLDQLQLNIRIAFTKSENDCRQDREQCRTDESDSKPAVSPGCNPVSFLIQTPGLIQQFFGSRIEVFAKRGEFHGAPRAVKQYVPQMLLKLSKLHADGCRGDKKPFGCVHCAAGFDNLTEVSKDTLI